MCTVIVYWRAFAGVPLLVAANRDERLGRPAAPPALLEHRGVSLLAPRDLEAGGTWLGLNQHGLFAALTNRFGTAKPQEARSRGALLMDTLAAPTIQEASEQVRGLQAGRESGFHLLLAGAEHAELWVNDGRALRRQALAPGRTVITERSFDAAPTTREGRIHRRLDALPADRAPTDGELQQILAEHAVVGIEGTCVHAPLLDYGTRSSTLLRLERYPHPGQEASYRFLHAEGPPCTHPHLPVTARLPPPPGA